MRPIEPPAFVGTVRVVMRGPEGVEDLVVRLEPAAARYLSVWELTFEERVAVIGGGNIVLSVIGAQPPVGMYVLEVGGPRACAAEAGMSAPKRIQRKRTKGWRMPEGAVYVGRGSKWGNPFRWESPSAIAALERGEITRADIVESPADAVQMFRDFIFPFDADLSELRGKDLACWCALDQPCHADVLLEWANAPGGAE